MGDNLGLGEQSLLKLNWTSISEMYIHEYHSKLYLYFFNNNNKQKRIKSSPPVFWMLKVDVKREICLYTRRHSTDDSFTRKKRISLYISFAPHSHKRNTKKTNLQIKKSHLLVGHFLGWLWLWAECWILGVCLEQ